MICQASAATSCASRSVGRSPEPEALSIRDGDLQRLRVSVPVVTNVFDR